MMKIRRNGALRGVMMAVLMPAFAACSNLFSGDDPTLVRLENTSAVELRDVTFSSGHDPLTYERLAPGERTAYVEVESSYSYGYLKVTANGREHVIQPIDYVGEEEIGPGRFTWRIGLTETGVTNNLRRND